MNFRAITKHKLFPPALGGVLTALCGLMLWKAPIGEAWVNASYDYLFRFGGRTPSNNVVLIQMDNEAYDHFHQTRTQPWDRELHAQLLNRLAADGCAMVVFDSFFRGPRDARKDQLLAEAMRQQKRVVLMAEQAEVVHSSLAGAHPALPYDLFLNAAGTNWGVAWLDPDLDGVARRHWPFPYPGPYPSLPVAAAKTAGAVVKDDLRNCWLRYYGANGAWTCLSYRFALTQPTNYFRNKIVFIGTQPKTTVPGDETDEFRTPYTRWTGESMGGAQIMVTSFVNLFNGDALRRSAGSIEIGLVLGAGLLIGLCAGALRPVSAGLSAVGFALLAAVSAICWTYFTNYWFPWLVIAGGQAPCAFLCSLATQRLRIERRGARVESDIEQPPAIPDYELLNPPFGEGSYGKVWLARNAIGQWQALKVIYRSNFGTDPKPYDREFSGIKKYKPISDKHPGLLRVDFVSQQKPEGYFFYVMELGDPLEAGWEHKPSTYKPRDLVSERRAARGQKLPVLQCLRIGIELADALEFLHQQGLTHRDIKPQNIIFVNGQPKMADMGLIAEIRPPEQERTSVGTPGYMPPPPELPGTPQADIYGLGMMLYVLSTGRSPGYFPEISTTLAGSDDVADFFPLNAVILKACHRDSSQRYKTAAEMQAALIDAKKTIECERMEKAH